MLLWVAFFLQQGTRQIFGATLSSIQGSLGVTAAQIGMIATVFTFAYGLSVPVAGVAMALFGVFRGVYDSNLMASLFDIIPPRYHASGAGIMLSCAFVFGSTSPVVLGILKDHFSSTVGLASLAGFYLVGAAIIFAARYRAFGRQRSNAPTGDLGV